MQFISYIVIGIVLLIIAGAVIKLIRDKKKGIRCPGCPGCSDDSSCNSCSKYSTHM